MNLATHLIKIRGTFDKDIWKEEELKDYIKSKIKNEIESVLHADLELYKTDKGTIEVWVFISALSSKATRDIIDKWLEDHITEQGIAVIDFEVEERSSLLSQENKFVVLI